MAETGNLLPRELIETIKAILRRGNCAEIKKTGGKILVVEIQRKVKISTSTTG